MPDGYSIRISEDSAEAFELEIEGYQPPVDGTAPSTEELITWALVLAMTATTKERQIEAARTAAGLCSMLDPDEADAKFQECFVAAKFEVEANFQG